MLFSLCVLCYYFVPYDVIRLIGPDDTYVYDANVFYSVVKRRLSIIIVTSIRVVTTQLKLN